MTRLARPAFRRPARGGGRAWPRGSVYALFGVTLLTCTVGFLQKLPCRMGAWNTGTGQYAYACYTDIYPLFFAEGLSRGAVPYIDHGVEYPVAMGWVMHALAWVVRPLDDPYVAGRAFYDLTVVLLTVAALVTVAATAHVAGWRLDRLTMLAAAPGLALAVYINWDLLAVALTALAVAAWVRRRTVTAGVLLGLAVATKFYPVVLLGPLFLLCLRAGRLGAFVRAFFSALAAWVAVNLPVYLQAPEGWATFYTFSGERGAGWGSVWLLLQRAGLRTVDDVSALNALGTGVFLLACAAIAVLALAAPRRPRLGQLAFLTIAAFILTNKVWSPQYVLWLLPFLVLARPRWPSFLAWQAAWLVYFLAIWYHLLEYVQPGAGIGDAAYLPALALRAVAVLALCALVVRDVLRPEHDVVRAEGVDDPAGGVLDGAGDGCVLRRKPGGAVREAASSEAS